MSEYWNEPRVLVAWFRQSGADWEILDKEPRWCCREYVQEQDHRNVCDGLDVDVGYALFSERMDSVTVLCGDDGTLLTMSIDTHRELQPSWRQLMMSVLLLRDQIERGE